MFLKMTDLTVPNGHADRVIEHASLSFQLFHSFFPMPRELTNTRTHFRRIDNEERNKFINTVEDFHPGRKVVCRLNFTTVPKVLFYGRADKIRTSSKVFLD